MIELCFAVNIKSRIQLISQAKQLNIIVNREDLIFLLDKLDTVSNKPVPYQYIKYSFAYESQSVRF